MRISFDDRSPIKDLRAWCIPVGGKDFQVKEGDAIETAVFGVENGELMTDLRSKLLVIPCGGAGQRRGLRGRAGAAAIRTRR